jgi:hypothetical protein
MRTWQKATLGVVVTILAIIAVLAGTGAYFVLRNLETAAAGETDANVAMDALRKRYAPREPLIEVVDPLRGDVRINRAQGPAAAPVRTLHVISWKSEDGELVRTQVPLWLARFSSINLASHLGVAPAKFRLTVKDIQQYGPGIVTDYRSPGTFRVLIWVD